MWLMTIRTLMLRNVCARTVLYWRQRKVFDLEPEFNPAVTVYRLDVLYHVTRFSAGWLTRGPGASATAEFEPCAPPPPPVKS